MKNIRLYVLLNNFIAELLNSVHLTMRSLHKLHLRLHTSSPELVNGFEAYRHLFWSLTFLLTSVQYSP